MKKNALLFTIPSLIAIVLAIVGLQSLFKEGGTKSVLLKPPIAKVAKRAISYVDLAPKHLLLYPGKKINHNTYYQSGPKVGCFNAKAVESRVGFDRKFVDIDDGYLVLMHKKSIATYVDSRRVGLYMMTLERSCGGAVVVSACYSLYRLTKKKCPKGKAHGVFEGGERIDQSGEVPGKKAILRVMRKYRKGESVSGLGGGSFLYMSKPKKINTQNHRVLISLASRHSGERCTKVHEDSKLSIDPRTPDWVLMNYVGSLIDIGILQSVYKMSWKETVKGQLKLRVISFLCQKK